MKAQRLPLLTACLLVSLHLTAQTPASVSGKISYEGMRRIDASQMRIVINGQEVRPGSPGAPDAPEGMPDVVSFTQKLVFAGTTSGIMAKEERDRPQGMMMRRTMGDGIGNGAGGGQPRDVRMSPPFEQQTYLDLGKRQRIEVMTIKKDSVTTVYRTDRPLTTVEGWQLSDKTKKIAGYTCHKATITRRINRRTAGGGGRNGAEPTANAAPAPAETGPGETYTVWYTTDLPMNYSPVADLTPPTGVVLQIESDSESFKATGVSMEAVAATAVEPPASAKVVSSEEMNEVRRKAMADFRLKAMGSMSAPGRN